MEVVERNAKGTANTFTTLSSLKAEYGGSDTTDVETEGDSEITHEETEDCDSEITHDGTENDGSEITHEETEDGDSEITHLETEDGDSEISQLKTEECESEITNEDTEDDDSENTHVETEDGDSETTPMNVEDDSKIVHVVREDDKSVTKHVEGKNRPWSDTMHASSSSDEDTLAEMEAAGWLRLMNEIHLIRDLSIDAIGELVPKRNKILKPNFEMASELCRGEYDRGFALIIGGLNESVQIEFEANSAALEDIVKKFDTKVSDVKSLISRRIKNTYKVLTIKKTTETPPQDMQNRDGIKEYACICTVILGFVIMCTFPDFPDPSFNFFLKWLFVIAIFVFTSSFYYCIGRFEGNPRKSQ